jgi:hypothetical protein
MARIALIYQDIDGDLHSHSFRLSNYQWGIYSVENETAQQARFNAWAEKVAPLLTSGFQIIGMRYINDLGAVVREVVPVLPEPGSHAADQGSSSFTVGFTYASPAVGLSDKTSHATSHLKLGHADFALPGHKRLLYSEQNADMHAYLAWISANFSLACKPDRTATLRNYVTCQFNGYYQAKRGN